MSMKEIVRCPKCDEPMEQMQACHLFCPNCGSHLD